MPAFLEKKLKAEYGANSKTPYKVMNAMGVMHGNQITDKGRAMERQHRMKRAALLHVMHRDKS